MTTKPYNRGQIAIATAIFFMLITSTIVFGLAGPVYREVKNTNEFVGSRESYYLSEALNEDLSYRVKKGLSVPAFPSLSLNGYTATGTVNAALGVREIITTGERQRSLRSIRTVLAETPTGVAFNYGTQSGNGGFEMGAGAGVNGNVYANGDITGANNSFVTGSAIAANSVPLTTDQSNSSPATPPNFIVFGDTSSTEDITQSFQTSTTSPINKLQFYIKKVGAPADATVTVYNDGGGVPGTNVLSTGTLNESSVSTSYSWIDVTLTPKFQLLASTTYWIVIDAARNASKYWDIGANMTYPSGAAMIKGGSWGATTPPGLDTYFKVFLGGVTATIDGVLVGTAGVGDAWAHTVTNSSIEGNLFCQTGSGNNKVCNTSQPDPAPQAMPLPDDVVTYWKNNNGGGTITGDHNVTSSASLGPKIITGNLTVDGPATILTLTGDLYVMGNVTVDNGSKVQLSSSYGTKSGVIVLDGYAKIQNGALFAGSGQPESFILLVTTSDCPASASCIGNNAIDIMNNAGTVILNAQKGTIHANNNAAANEITAYKIVLDNNAVVTYQSGLVNVNFTSGPSGGYDIDSWHDMQ